MADHPGTVTHRRPRWPACLLVAASLIGACTADPPAESGVDRSGAQEARPAGALGRPTAAPAVTKTWADNDPALAGEVDLVDPAGPEPGPAWLYEFPPVDGGTSIGRIMIPNAGTDAEIVYGVGQPELAMGPGLMPRTAMPGQWGNSLIAAHRTTFGAWFHDIDLLAPGDEIIVETGLGTHTYAVVSTEIVLPTAMWVAQHREGAWLTLVACHPKGSAAERIIVFAGLIDGPNIAAATAAFPGPYRPPQDPEIGEIARRHHAQVGPENRRV